MTEKVDIDIVKYYQSCLRSYESASSNDKYDEVLKAVASLNKNGIKVCYHASICYIMEKFVKEYSTPEVIGCLFRSINAYLEGVIVGKNTSRLLEKVLISCQSKEVTDDELVQFQAQKFCDYMWTHYPDNLENNIGSHIVRLFFQFACGVYANTEGKVYSSKSAILGTPMAENYESKLEDLIQRFLLNDNIAQLLTNECMSSTLQILLVICKVRCPDRYSEVAKHIMSALCGIDEKVMSKNADKIQIPDSFKDKYQSFFLECFIVSLPDGKCWKRFSKAYLQLGKDEFISTIFTNSDSCGLFKAAIMQTNNPGILLEIAQTIKTSLVALDEFECGNVFLKLLNELVNKISVFPESEQSALRSYKNALIEIVQILSKCSTGTLSLAKFLTNGIKLQSKLEDDNEEEEQEEKKVEETEKICSLWASLLMQTIMNSFKPIPKSVNKLFTLCTPEEIVTLASDSKASRVLDAFIKATDVPDEVKIRFFDSLTPDNMSDVACSTFGSRVMDSVWDSGNNTLISLVKTKLDPQRSKLKSHKIGRFIDSKFFGYIPKQKGKINDDKKNTVNQKRVLMAAFEAGSKMKKQKFNK